VSDTAQERAREGQFWDGGGWAELTAGGTAGESTGGAPLLDTCGCRACTTAARGYLAHLWAMREITAEHLLGWHNLYQLLRLVEG